MNDRAFLIWIHARLTDVHGENPLVDYMHKLRAVIKATPADQLTPNVAPYNNLKDLISDLANAELRDRSGSGAPTTRKPTE